MSELKVGHCLPLYLQNMLVLGALEDADDLPQNMNEDQQLLATFRERASEQAVQLLEDVFSTTLSGQGCVPYRADRRSQRRTVREYWYVEGRLYRPRERTARAFWNLHLGCLKDKGPALTYVIGPQETASPVAMDDLASQVAPAVGLESANPRHCFTHKTGYEAGVVAAVVPLTAALGHAEASKKLREGIESFFGKHRAAFETALEA
jgi:hypothetical protein